jgi:hypothetical protein
MNKIIPIFLIALLTTTSTFASSTLVVNDSVRAEPIEITYKICDSFVSPAYACSKVQTARIAPQKSLEVNLKNNKEVLYVLSATIKEHEKAVAHSTYLPVYENNGGTFCSGNQGNFLVLNTHYTAHVGCQQVIG